MRFDEEPVAGEYEKWTMDEWFTHAAGLDYDTKLDLVGHWRWGYYRHHQHNWEKRRNRAVNIVLPGFVMADNLAKEMDR